MSRIVSRLTRRDFLRALAGGTVAALLGVQPRQLGEADPTGWSPGWDYSRLRRKASGISRTYTIRWGDGVDTGLTARSAAELAGRMVAEIEKGP